MRRSNKRREYDVSTLDFSGRTSFSLIRSMMYPYRFHFGYFFFITSVTSVLWALGPWLISRVIDRLTVNPEIDAEIWTLVLFFGLLQLADEIIWRSSDFFVSTFYPQMIERVRTTLFSQILKRKHGFFVDSSSGRIGHWINQTVRTMVNIVDQTLWDTWRHITGLVISAVFLLSAHWVLSVIFSLWMLGLFFFNVRRGRTLKRLVAAWSDEESLASGSVVDSVSNHTSVKTFTGTEIELRRLQEIQQRFVKKRRTSWRHNTFTNGIKGTSNGVVNTLALVTILLLFAKGSVPLGSIVLFMVYFGNASNSIWELSWLMDQYFSDFGTIQNALDGLNGADERSGDDAKAGQKFNKLVSVTFEELCFAYPEQPSQPVLKNISLDIKPGEKVGLVGHSGAGKSTLLSLLLAFHESTSGTIRIDDQNIGELDPSTLRSLLSYVPQNTSLFNRTVKENVLYALPSASDEKLRDALEAAEAWEFIEQLPSGLDSLIGEHGVKLSGGQRQRLSIARAILKDAPILLLDEATSALDSVSEQAIQRSLFLLMEDRTTLVIAHRLSTLQQMDRIAVIGSGQIVELGSHAELLALDGIYADLWSRQKDGFLTD